MTDCSMGALSRLIEDMSTVPSPGSLHEMRVVFLNGPPGAGKDTAGAALVERLGARTLKFAEPLKRAVFADAGLPLDTPIDFFDPLKEVPLALFGGRSFRQACIDKSEIDLKPRYGDDYFGRLAVRSLARFNRVGEYLVAVTDSGFTTEAEPVMRAVGADNCLLVRLHADGRGKTFAGDSRSHLDLPIMSIDIDNDLEGDKQSFLDDVLDAVEGWL